MDQHSIWTWLGNIFSASAIMGAIVGWTPVLAAIIGLVYYLIQIYESATFQKWLATRRQRKLAKLRAAVAKLETTQSQDD